MNKAFIIGNLTKDPDLRTTQSGISVCSFNVAVQRRYKDQNGEKAVDYIPVIVWRGLAENCAKYLAKGKKVAVSGEIQTRSYDKDGTKRYVTEILASDVEFLTPVGTTSANDVPPPQEVDFTPVDDEELPF